MKDGKREETFTPVMNMEWQQCLISLNWLASSTHGDILVAGVFFQHLTHVHNKCMELDLTNKHIHIKTIFYSEPKKVKKKKNT
jgi:hypothetical protein